MNKFKEKIQRNQLKHSNHLNHISINLATDRLHMEANRLQLLDVQNFASVENEGRLRHQFVDSVVIEFLWRSFRLVICSCDHDVTMYIQTIQIPLP